MNENSKRERIFTFIFSVAAITGCAIFIAHIVGYEPADYFFSDGKPKDPYTTVNVVSRWADFAYFTYISLILFCIYGILRAIASMCKIQKLKKFVFSDRVIVFVCLNQFIVMLLYTVFELAFGGKFGWYGNYPKSWYSLITNIIVHYFITSAAVVYFFMHDFGHMQLRKCLPMAGFLVLYAAIVKVTGMTCYSFEWYPYPIFSAKSMWHYLFGEWVDYNAALAISITISVDIVLFFAYILLLFGAVRYANRNAAK